MQNAFAATWETCESVSDPKLCQPKLPDPDLVKARKELSATVAARARAVRALNAAYGALADEASYDARADASAAFLTPGTSTARCA